MIEPTPKVDRLPHLVAYGKAYELAAGNVDAMHDADVAYFNAEAAADAADAAAYSAAYRATLDPHGAGNIGEATPEEAAAHYTRWGANTAPVGTV